MTPKRLRSMLDGLDDLSEFVLAGPLELVEQTGDALLADWRAAASEADAAYANWRRRRDRDSYATYRACADRADAAQDALAARAGAPARV
jgi:hypothetical protein